MDHAHDVYNTPLVYYFLALCLRNTGRRTPLRIKRTASLALHVLDAGTVGRKCAGRWYCASSAE